MKPAAARPAFVFDVNRCVGCRACEMACVITNGAQQPAQVSWRQVRTFNELRVPGVELLHLSLACNHCTEAPCMEQCPARAYHRDAETGAVLIDPEKCLGCRYCAWVCPYDAPRFDTARGVMTKCTFCSDRQHQGQEPACTLSCPTGALGFDRLPSEQLTQEVVGMPADRIGPALQVVGLAVNRRLPETHLPPALPPWRSLWKKLEPHITLRHEWVLAVFTLLLAVLTGLLAGAATGRLNLPWSWFLAAGLTGLLLSASHLGQKQRTWRAGLHPDRSWLSREVVLTGGFLAAGTVSLALPWLPGWTAWAAYSLGLVTLLTADLVYRVAMIRGAGPLHSAQVLGTGLLLTAAVVGDQLVLISLVILKLILFWTRQLSRRRRYLAAPAIWLWWRSGLLLAGGGLAVTAAGFSWAAVAVMIAAEMIDRGLFYLELEILTPGSRLLDELEDRIASSGLASPDF